MKLSLILVALLILPAVSASIYDPDPVIWPLHWDDIIAIFETVLALSLGAISWMAFKRDGRKKLMFVAIAFFIFAMKGFLKVGADFLHAGNLISSETPLDLVADLLDFAVLTAFFLGMIKN